ncbi:TPA: hypothetical protein ACGBQD_002856 [Escherichia coli]|uniref:hypothetical protein n=1 Tax=Escherichia coli TaxID=562 RepID=UPI001414A436|nr:hypothetical protein [Escherichia coli]EFI6379339.1 hypothetical protein [Escherichia coli]EFO2789099.1 hypothetical protein [Escherichia coli]MBC1087689.1 hypothetical protein [Escherichia coli]MBS8870581.1 hypothetical protein [Escherichia coli]MDN1906522.1 hypothetical protein [Escherichia coli]
MDMSCTRTTEPKWSCADLLSSYRFWGIVIVYLLLSIAYALGATYSLAYWMSSLHISSKFIGVIVISGHFGSLFGLILGWFLCRLKNRYSLFIPVLCLMFGAVLCLNVNDASESALLAIGQFLSGMSQGMAMLLIPVLLVAGASSVETFTIALGMCLIIKYLVTISLAIVAAYVSEYLILLTFTASSIALLLLLPMKKALFYTAPPLRHSSAQQPYLSTPFLATLLSFCIPFYIVYWFFKTHQQLQFISPSSRLMTAKGAGWLSALGPFGNALLCMMLNDEINKLLTAKEAKAGIKTGWVLFWSLLLPPIGIAIIQTKMNRVITTYAINTESKLAG